MLEWSFFSFGSGDIKIFKLKLHDLYHVLFYLFTLLHASVTSIGRLLWQLIVTMYLHVLEMKH